MTHSAVLLALDGLAVARLTRLVIADTITAPLRTKLLGSRPGITRTGGGERIMVVARPRLAVFLTCPYCVSVYVAIGVVVLQTLAPRAWLYASAVLAFSLIAGLIGERF